MGFLDSLKSFRTTKKFSKTEGLIHDDLRVLAAGLDNLPAIEVVQDFLIEGGNLIPLRKQESLINGKNWWTTTVDDSTITVSYNSADTLWEWYLDGDLAASKVSTKDVPPSGVWDLEPTGTYILYFSEYTGTLQSIIELLASNTMGAYFSSNTMYNNTIVPENPLTSTTVQDAIDELATTTLQKPTTVVVDISSAQILDSGTTAISIPDMPDLDPASSKYYDIERVKWEFTPGLTAYSGSKSLSFVDLDTNNNIDTVPISMFTVLYKNFYDAPLYTGNIYSLIKKVGFKSLAGAVTTGTGKLKVTITFRVKVFNS
jgi:hypothetical protein